VAAQPVAPGDTAGTNGMALGPGDEVEITVLEVQELTARRVRVEPDGSIGLPFIGTMKVSGLTSEDLRLKLTKALKRFVRDPKVSINLVDIQSRPVSVLGAVVNPGVYQLRGEKRLAEILSTAGGLRPDAGSIVKVTRQVQMGQIPVPNSYLAPGGEAYIAELDVDRLLNAESPVDNMMVQAKDVITVPKAPLVYVVGDVVQPGAFGIDQSKSTTVLQALSMARGLTRTAAAGDARILRVVLGGPRRVELPVNLKKILHGGTQDQVLVADDILYIPSSAGKIATARIIDAALQLGTTSLVLFGR
jgi:polysaccharide biosynthesis/export protein